MDIKIGKADIASLGCEGCKKKFICNVANNDPIAKSYIESKIGIQLPQQDPPAIIDNSGGDGEKGIILYLLNQGKSVSSMGDAASFTHSYNDATIGQPYIIFRPSDIPNLERELSKEIARAQYTTENATDCNNMIAIARRGTDYFYQLSLTPSFADLYPYLIPAASTVYSRHNIYVSKRENHIRPDLIKIIQPSAGIPVLTDDFRQGISDGAKYILEVCDIKTSEFTSSFFFELGYYMVLLKSWLNSTGLSSQFEVSYKALIFPFDVVNNSIRDIDGWRMEFSLVKEKLFNILNYIIPEILNAIETGDKTLIEIVKRSPRCQVCDYYGGQYEGKLYEKYRRRGPSGKADYEAYIKDPNNHFCRYYLCLKQDINILPSIKTSEIKYLQDKGILDLASLKTELRSGTLLTNNTSLMANSHRLIKEIDIHGSGTFSRKVNITNLLAPMRAQLQIYTIIRQDSQRRTLCYGISYSVYVANVDTTTIDSSMVVDATGLLKENNSESPYLVEIDSSDVRHKLTALIEYMLKMKEVLERFNRVMAMDRYGNRTHVSYGIFYWGKKTYDAFKDNIQSLLEYIADNGGSVGKLYPGMSATRIAKIDRAIKQAINEFADIFSDEDVTYYERILKSPLFDLKTIYSNVVAVDTNFNYNLMDVYNTVFGKNDLNYHYRPDSDNYSAYTFDSWFSVDRITNPGEKTRQQMELQSRDKQHFYYLAMLYNELYNSAGVLGSIIKKGVLPLLGMGREDPNIRNGRLLYLYFFQKMNAAYDQVEIENNHIAPDVQKQFGGKSIKLIRELTNSELGKFGINLTAHERAYFSEKSVENANLDVNAFGLTIYPEDKFMDTFKKITNVSGYNSCLYVDVDLPSWKSFKLYTNVVNCDISYMDVTNKIIKLHFDTVVESIISELETRYGYDFSQNLYVEDTFKDFWSVRLKNTAIDLQKRSRQHKLAVFENPTLRHERHYSTTDVEDVINSAISRGTALLDDSQKRAIATIYNDNISLLWGPPGTGKSYTLGHYMLLELIEQVQCKILLLGNYTATDNLLNSLLSRIKEYECAPAIADKLDIVRFHSYSKELEPLMPIPGVSDRQWKSNDPELNILRPFTVISSTPDQLSRIADRGPNGTRIRRQLASLDQFDIVIVDEASQMDVGHFLPGLLRIFASATSHSKIVIAGDDKQLQPIRKEEIHGDNETLFGSIYNYYRDFETSPGVKLLTPVSLDESRRSNRCIIDFIRMAFEYKPSFISAKPFDKIEYTNHTYSSQLFEAILKPEIGLALLEYDDGLSNQKNQFEVDQISALVREVWNCEIKRFLKDLRKFFGNGIGIVVPHTAQRTAVRNRLFDDFKTILPEGGYTDVELREIINGSVDTVERFQGQERDLIISGYVLGNEDAIASEEAFIYDKCRMNVIISRARYKAIVLASRELMNNISDDIKIIDLQRPFQLLKDYCNSKTCILEPGWKNGMLYTRDI